jgi:hypothetical protein
MREQLAIAQAAMRWPMMQPAIRFLSDLLTRSRLNDPSKATEFDERAYSTSALLPQIEMIFQGPKPGEMVKLIDDYRQALYRYSQQKMSRDEIEQLRQQTIAKINALIGLPL